MKYVLKENKIHDRHVWLDNKSESLITKGEIIFFFSLKLNKTNKSSITKGEIVLFLNRGTKNTLNKKK